MILFTTLMWVLLWTPGLGITGFDWLWLGLAVVLDIWGLANGGRNAWLNRNSVPGYASMSGNTTTMTPK